MKKQVIIIVLILLLLSLFAGCVYVNPLVRLESKKKLLIRLSPFRSARFPVKII